MIYKFVIGSLFVVLLPVSVGVIRFNRLSHFGKLITFMLFLGALIDGIAFVVARAQGNNMPVYYFYFVGLALLLGWYFYSLLSMKWIVYLFMGLALLPLIEFVLFDQHNFSSSSALINLAATGFCLYSFQQMALNRISHEAYWLTGILMFKLVCSVVYFATYRYLVGKGQLDYLVTMGLMNSVANSISYILYTFALWKQSRSYSPAH